MEELTIEQLIADTSFVNYCLGTDIEDIAYWTSWIDDHPQYDTLLEEAKKMVFLLKDVPSLLELEGERARIIAYIEAGESSSKRRIVYWKPLAAVAAAILILIGIAQFILPARFSAPLKKNVPIWVNQEVPPKKTMELRLEDGTKVTLSPSSKLSYPKTFSDTLRMVRLDGSGFFDVQRQPEKPFVIATSDAQIRVLGTSFSLEAFEGDGSMKLALFTGKVAFSTGQVYKEIESGTTLVFNKFDGSISLFDFDPTSPAHVGDLLFEHASFEEVRRKVSRFYGVTFVASSEIDMEFSGKFQNESLNNVLDDLTHTTGYHFAVKADTVFVTQK
ncbi:FecR family protein [Sphingobacterium gobiense]|uniref:FecR protein domain-containing protein n=1 Tax=Sphingobacterium gobiense TaxID=1382456 RepID=A0A2S9JTR1_9SPHI|nr:FecR family protein [Sphingobacterium gobiense]PRD56677.1 hypothetical protein C5749_05455 [Sphingobacterium gobiense]